MANRNFKLAILRAKHVQNAATISDPACLSMFFSNPAGQSVLQYWQKVTDDYVDFDGSALQPWVDIEIGDDVSRENQLQKAYDATAALPNASLDGFDGFAVISHPATAAVTNPNAGMAGQPATIVVDLDGGATSVAGRPGCALPTNGNHTFFCHEVGHVLGFQHTYGVWNNGADWDRANPPHVQNQVYGDPYDIMSSASFGTRNLDPAIPNYVSNPVFAGTAITDWPNAGAVGSMGPEPARAHVHFWASDAIPLATFREVPAPIGTSVRRQRLTAAGRHSGAVSLLVIHPPGEDAAGLGRMYIEFREAIGWDQGLDRSGADLARQAIVVHAIADTAEGVRCWYRGRILVPFEIDTDLQIAGTPYTVRASSYDQSAGTVEVEVTAAAFAPYLTIETNRHVNLVSEGRPRTIGTPCGDRITSADRVWETTSYYAARASGLGGQGAPDVAVPAVEWRLENTLVPAGASTFTVTKGADTYTVGYENSPTSGELILTSMAGDSYALKLEVKVTDSSGQSASDTTSFQAVGKTSGFSASDLRKLDDCIVRRFRQVRVRSLDWLIPREPDHFGINPVDRENRRRIDALVSMIDAERADVRRDLQQLVELRYGR